MLIEIYKYNIMYSVLVTWLTSELDSYPELRYQLPDFRCKLITNIYVCIRYYNTIITHIELFEGENAP